MISKSTWNRRHFIKNAGVGTLAALAAGSPVRRASASEESTVSAGAPGATADTVILLWMAGGMAHTETFDPKRYTPYETGLDPNRVLSTFPSIPTSLDGVQLSEGLENVASVLKHGTLIRSYKAADLGFILHSRHQYHWHTCYQPPQTVAAPHIGSWIAKELGPKNPVIPAFINIGQRFTLGEKEELKAFHTAGFLGAEYGPFLIPDPTKGLESVRPPEGMTAERFEKRRAIYDEIVKRSPVGEFGSGYQQESLSRSMEQAYRLLNSPEAQAFDLSREPKEIYDAYNTGKFGQGCLLARRLTEAGARFITVSSEYVPFLGWDTHENGHERLIEMKRQIDVPIARLVLELKERGLLDRTMIVLASEFSRDMMMEGRPGAKVKDQVHVPDRISEPKHYGMHRHFTDGCSMLMFGGGVKQGQVYGKTADERPCLTVEKPVDIAGVHQTIYHALGIPADTHYDIERRPFYTTPDGKGKPVLDLLG
ncbi:MAG: DUF1501 domain-containing protein [Verrucomicrobiales bacterium]|nr:DUF1501 domain-containing protein [Verrucomicrobiae bacterium]